MQFELYNKIILRYKIKTRNRTFTSQYGINLHLFVLKSSNCVRHNAQVNQHPTSRPLPGQGGAFDID